MPTAAPAPAPAQTTVADEPVLKAPENESALANLAMPLGDTIVKLQGENQLLYGVVQRNRAVTPQSDFFRVQFKGLSSNSGHVWTPFNDEDGQFHVGRNCAWAKVDHPSRSIVFGPKNGVIVGERMRAPGLEDFLFAAVVSWAKNTYPDYSASPGMLMMQARGTDEERLHRQAFYAKQGFEFEWNDQGQRSALYYKDRVGRLIGVCESTLIVEFGGEAMLQTLIKQDQERQELEQRMVKIEALNNVVHQALDKERHTTQVLTVALLFTLVIVLWAVL